MATDNEVSIPKHWKGAPLKLEEQDSERFRLRNDTPVKPEVTAEYLAEQAEIERLSEKAAAIPGRDSWKQ